MLPAVVAHGPSAAELWRFAMTASSEQVDLLIKALHKQVARREQASAHAVASEGRAFSCNAAGTNESEGVQAPSFVSLWFQLPFSSTNTGRKLEENHGLYDVRRAADDWAV